jgi:hypothetical protein
MGFQDMKSLNKALLAKQAWRLIQYPESLCAKLLKAKYYPHTELVDAVFPSDASQTWKLIVYGLELLKEGIIWRVGSGSKIQIWRDLWIDRGPSRRFTMKRTRTRLRWVSQLMIPERHEWDEQLLRIILYPHDVHVVLKVRLSERVMEDFVAWYYEKSGIFLVRSAYHLAVQLDRANQNMAGCSSWPDGNRPIYNGIWKAAVPPKIHVFAWCLSQDSLATQTNQKTQTLENGAICQLCGMEAESGHHSMVRCMKVVVLRHEMCKHWSLLGELQFRYSGPDWLP